MIWGSAALIEEAYEGINLLNTMLTVTRARPPVEFLERQMAQIRAMEKLHGAEVDLEAWLRMGSQGSTEDLLAALRTGRFAIVDMEALAVYQEELAWDLYEQGVISRDDALRAIPPGRRPVSTPEFTEVPDEEFTPISSGIFAEMPADPPKGLRDLKEP